MAATAQRICFIVEGTATMSCFWHDMRTRCIDPVLKDLSTRDPAGDPAGAAFELALVVCGSPAPWSMCPLQRSGWTQDLPRFRQWLDAVSPSGGGSMQPLLAEAMAEAIYLFQCPTSLSGGTGSVEGHTFVLLVSEPYRTLVPWPYPDECGSETPCQAGWADLAKALRKHGSDFSFSAGQVQNNKVMIQRLVKAFALAQDLRRVEEVQALSLRPAPGIMSCVSAKWPAALAILRQEASRARQTSDGEASARPGVATPSDPSQGMPTSTGSIATPPLEDTFAAAQAGPSGMAAAPGHHAVTPPQATASPMGTPLPPHPRTLLWQGTLLLGEKLSKGPVQRLWQCKAYVHSKNNHVPALGQNWPAELVINKLTGRGAVAPLIKDSSRSIVKGVLELVQAERTGEVLARSLATRDMAAIVDMTAVLGVQASIMILPMPQRPELIFILATSGPSRGAQEL